MYLPSPSLDMTQAAHPKAARDLELVELRDLARQIFEALTPAERFVLHLVFWSGFTLVEIAGMTSISKQSAHETYQRALRKGRIALGDFEAA